MKSTNTTIQASQIACQGCANTVKAALQKIAGVEDASVDLAAQRVTVKHDSSVPREDLVNALTEAGFPAA